jgi:hypothetical protein
MQRTAWVYWENPKGQIEIPAHIKLCVRTIERSTRTGTLQLLNAENARDVVSSLPSWWDDLETLAHKADILKAHLLYHHGGIVLDADTITVRDLEFMFTLLERGIVFFGFGPSGDPSIGVLAARRGSRVAQRWLENQLAAFERQGISWCTFGNDSLSPVVQELGALCLPWHLTHPFPWYDWQRYLSHETAETFGDGTYAMFSLFNKMLGPSIYDVSEEDLLNSPSLVSQLFRIALDEQRRKWFCRRDVFDFCELPASTI